MPRIARNNTLREIHRVLKDGGRLLVVDYHKPGEFIKNILLNIATLVETNTAKDMIKQGLRNEMESNGFQIGGSKLMAMGLIEAIIAKKIISPYRL